MSKYIYKLQMVEITDGDLKRGDVTYYSSMKKAIESAGRKLSVWSKTGVNRISDMKSIALVHGDNGDYGTITRELLF